MENVWAQFQISTPFLFPSDWSSTLCNKRGVRNQLFYNQSNSPLYCLFLLPNTGREAKDLPQSFKTGKNWSRYFKTKCSISFLRNTLKCETRTPSACTISGSVYPERGKASVTYLSLMICMLMNSQNLQLLPAPYCPSRNVSSFIQPLI